MDTTRYTDARLGGQSPVRGIRVLLTLLLCLSCLGLFACGPKDISTDSARVDREYYGKGGPDPMSDARYPIPGVASRKDYYFYRLNQPAVFEAMQNWRMTQFRRGLQGIDPEHPSYREVPKQRSPFRQ